MIPILQKMLVAVKKLQTEAVVNNRHWEVIAYSMVISEIADLNLAIREQEQQALRVCAHEWTGPRGDQRCIWCNARLIDQSNKAALENTNDASAAQSAREQRIDAVMRAYNSAVINKNAITRWDAKGLVAVLEAWEGMK